MSLLKRFDGIQLKALLEQHLIRKTSEEELLKLFGPEPYFWEIPRSPKYSQFNPKWRDSDGREYMSIDTTHLAVRLPIRKNRDHFMTFPAEFEKILLTEIGGGNIMYVLVVSVSVGKGRSATGWIEYQTA